MTKQSLIYIAGHSVYHGARWRRWRSEKEVYISGVMQQSQSKIYKWLTYIFHSLVTSNRKNIDTEIMHMCGILVLGNLNQESLMQVRFTEGKYVRLVVTHVCLEDSAVPWLEHCPWGGGGGWPSNLPNECGIYPSEQSGRERRHEVPSPNSWGAWGGHCAAPGKFWNLPLLKGLKSLLQHRI